MTSKTNLEKRLWEESPAGKIQVKAKKVFNRIHDKKKITEDDVRWLDIHRAKGMSKEKDFVMEYEADVQKVIDKKKDVFRKKYDKLMIDMFQTELDYLLKIEERE